MDNFDYREASKALGDRFPEGALGRAWWQSLQEPRPNARSEWFPSPSNLRAAKTHFSVPRVFVSHKREDLAAAVDVANWVRETGCYTWFDAENLPGVGDPVLIAGIIEMALLNSTHVIAVMTQRTLSSTWVPYEYGRVKADLPHSDTAACWVPRDLLLPAYLYLGEVTRTKGGVQRWLRVQRGMWPAIRDM